MQKWLIIVIACICVIGLCVFIPPLIGLFIWNLLIAPAFGWVPATYGACVGIWIILSFFVAPLFKGVYKNAD